MVLGYDGGEADRAGCLGFGPTFGTTIQDERSRRGGRSVSSWMGEMGREEDISSNRK